jgi:ribonuclease VapC
MFVDASAAIAILGGEEDGVALSLMLEGAHTVLVSPISLYETVAGLARKRECPIEEAKQIVDLFVAECAAQTVPITPAIGDLAIAAFAQFGKGRHKADLNMGDCFAYACARFHEVPLLFKGNDFVHTDIASVSGSRIP